MPSLRTLTCLVAVACLFSACSNLRHPLDDSETRPETETMALEEAAETLDAIGDAVMGGVGSAEHTWTGEGGCATAPFAPSQGEVGLVLVRTYTVDSLEQVGPPDALFDDFEHFWSDQNESSTRSSPNMDPGVVSRVNGIAYEVVSLPPEVELRAFIPCY